MTSDSNTALYTQCTADFTALMHDTYLCTWQNHSCVLISACNLTGLRIESLSAKCQTTLHGHRLRTLATDMSYNTTNERSHKFLYNLLYNKFTTNGQKFATSQNSQHLDMSRFWALALRCGKFAVQQLVELLRARPLVVSVGGVVQHVRIAGVRVVEFGPNSSQARSSAW